MAARRGPTAKEGTRDAQRRALLDVASRLLATEGEQALSVRRLAAEYGASTMVVYSLFEGKEGLYEALLAEGFRRFAEALGRVGETAPWAHLRSLGRAYRRFALENPTYYVLLWTHRPPVSCREDDAARAPRERGLHAEARVHGEAAFRSLVVAVGRVVSPEHASAKEVETLAHAVWSSVHGAVSLELAGIHPDAALAERAYEHTLDFVERALGRSRK